MDKVTLPDVIVAVQCCNNCLYSGGHGSDSHQRFLVCSRRVNTEQKWVSTTDYCSLWTSSNPARSKKDVNFKPKAPLCVNCKHSGDKLDLFICNKLQDSPSVSHVSVCDLWENHDQTN